MLEKPRSPAQAHTAAGIQTLFFYALYTKGCFSQPQS